MAAESNMSLPLGTEMPSFELPDVVDGTLQTQSFFDGSSARVVVFLCRHCPYVVHVRDALIRLAGEYETADAKFLSISSNDASRYPDDAPAQLKEMALEEKFPFPVLYDENQSVAKAFSAACTPDFFIFNAENKLAYRGRFDDSNPGNGRPVTGKDLREALDAIRVGKPATGEQLPSLGCSIKWK
ncbi:MAG: thioredoxin family protein [Chthoniobacterales bacterium]